MTKREFQEQQKAEMDTRYAELRSQKKRRQEALEIMAKEFDKAPRTISGIMNTKKYYNRSKPKVTQ